jgi:hypothetical protein
MFYLSVQIAALSCENLVKVVSISLEKIHSRYNVAETESILLELSKE